MHINSFDSPSFSTQWRDEEVTHLDYFSLEEVQQNQESDTSSSSSLQSDLEDSANGWLLYLQSEDTAPSLSLQNREVSVNPSMISEDRKPFLPSTITPLVPPLLAIPENKIISSLVAPSDSAETTKSAAQKRVSNKNKKRKEASTPLEEQQPTKKAKSSAKEEQEIQRPKRLEDNRLSAQRSRDRKKLQLKELLQQQQSTLELGQTVENYANIFRQAHPLTTLPHREIPHTLTDDQKISLCHERIEQIIATVTNEVIHLKAENAKAANKEKLWQQHIQQLEGNLFQAIVHLQQNAEIAKRNEFLEHRIKQLQEQKH